MAALATAEAAVGTVLASLQRPVDVAAAVAAAATAGDQRTAAHAHAATALAAALAINVAKKQPQKPATRAAWDKKATDARDVAVAAAVAAYATAVPPALHTALVALAAARVAAGAGVAAPPPITLSPTQPSDAAATAAAAASVAAAVRAAAGAPGGGALALPPGVLAGLAALLQQLAGQPAGLPAPPPGAPLPVAPVSAATLAALVALAGGGSAEGGLALHATDAAADLTGLPYTAYQPATDGAHHTLPPGVGGLSPALGAANGGHATAAAAAGGAGLARALASMGGPQPTPAVRPYGAWAASRAEVVIVTDFDWAVAQLDAALFPALAQRPRLLRSAYSVLITELVATLGRAPLAIQQLRGRPQRHRAHAAVLQPVPGGCAGVRLAPARVRRGRAARAGGAVLHPRRRVGLRGFPPRVGCSAHWCGRAAAGPARRRGPARGCRRGRRPPAPACRGPHAGARPRAPAAGGTALSLGPATVGAARARTRRQRRHPPRPPALWRRRRLGEHAARTRPGAGRGPDEPLGALQRRD